MPVIPDLLWYSHPECSLHEMGPSHPESPLRLRAIEACINDSSVDVRRQVIIPEAASSKVLGRVHHKAWVEKMVYDAPMRGYHKLDEDTIMNEHTAEAALLAAGACVQAVHDVTEKKPHIAFCSVRPPGHHAERNMPMGFCIFDNIAVAAAEAMEMGMSRIAILDFDVHYGNGTADIFRNEKRVLLCNTYQYPLYPFWPDGGGGENFVDVPLQPGAGSKEFREGVTTLWQPALEKFRPEIILVSAGFDAHRDDPLANLELVTDDYRWMGTLIRDWAEKTAGGRVVATLEGGYNLAALGASVVAFHEGLLGKWDPAVSIIPPSVTFSEADS